MSEKKSSSSSGIGLASVLGVVFIVLKLTDNIDWSWWLVLLPFWIGIAVVLGALLVAGVFMLVGAIIALVLERRANRQISKLMDKSE